LWLLPLPDTKARLKALGHLPVALLVVVALHQLGATVYGDLTPWLGGGFGMFATLDTPGNRVISAHLLEPDFRREIVIPESLSDAAERARAFPTRRRLTELAGRLAANPQYSRHTAEAVELSVWRIRPKPEPIRTVRVNIDR
jgi:hypothetical protein